MNTSSSPDFVNEEQVGELHVGLRADGIIVIRVPSNLEIDVDYVKLIVSLVGKTGDHQLRPVLILAGENTLPSPEARDYIALEDSDPYAKAEAYVVTSLAQKLVGNVFLSFNKPIRPTKVFNSEEKALEWLKGFL